MSRERSVSSSSGFTDLYGPLFYCSFLFHLLIYMMRIRDMCKEAYIYICFSSGVDSDPRHVMAWDYRKETWSVRFRCRSRPKVMLLWNWKAVLANSIMPYMRLSGCKISLLLPFHPVLNLDRDVSCREMLSGIKLHWPSNNKSSMSTERDVIQVVHDYPGVNDEIIRMRETVLYIAEATKVCGYYWPTLYFLVCSLSMSPDAHDPHRWVFITLLITFRCSTLSNIYDRWWMCYHRIKGSSLTLDCLPAKLWHASSTDHMRLMLTGR